MKVSTPLRFTMFYTVACWLMMLAKVIAAWPTSFAVDCISWSEEGGQCQALHAIVRLRDDVGNPVNGASVEIETNKRISGKKKKGKFIRETSSSLFASYQAEVDAMCPTDGAPYSGTTSAFCWQQAIVQFSYEVDVVAIEWPIVPTLFGFPVRTIWPLIHSRGSFVSR